MPGRKKNNTSKSQKNIFSRSRLIFYILTVILFGATIYYFSTIKKDVLLMEKLNIFWLAAALVAQGMTYVIAALVYMRLLGSFNHRHIPGVCYWIQASIVALFLNQAVPSAGLSGNAFIFSFLSRKKIPAHNIVSLIIIELLSFYLAMELVVLFLLAVSFIMPQVSVFFPSILGAGIIVFLVLFFGMSFLGKKTSLNWLYKKLSKVRWIKKLMESSEAVTGTTAGHRIPNAWTLIGKHKKAMFIAIALQVGVMLADSFTIFSLFEGLGRDINFLYILLGLICAKIISVIPFLPGALILYESSMTYAFVSLGVPLAAAVIVTLAYRILSFWLPIPLGLILYGRLTKED